MKRYSYEIDVNTSNKKLHIQTCAQEEDIERLILIPPLVGASAIQQILYFKYFLKPGYANKLISYDYSGHNKSPLNTTFSLSGSIEETKEAILYAIAEAQNANLSLHIIGTCYSTIPILISLQQLGWPDSVSSLSNFNGLTRMDKILTANSFLPFLAMEDMDFKDAGTLLSFLDDHVENAQETLHSSIINAMINFLRYKFPELGHIINSDSFGELCYSRSEVIKTLIEFIGFGSLDVQVPEAFACCFVYGKEDRLLNLDDTGGENIYRSEIRKLTTGAIIKAFNLNHYGRGSENAHCLEYLYQYMKAMEMEHLADSS